MRAIKRRCLGDDVGNQPRAQALDLVLEQELALLEAAQLELVLRGVAHQAADDIVEIVVFDLERLEALTDLSLFLFGRRRIDHAVTNIIRGQSSYPYTRARESPPCVVTTTTLPM